MKIINLLAIFLCLSFSSSTVLAQMYKWVDKEGNISYSDQPPYKGAEQLDAPALSTMPATTAPKKSPATADTPEDETDKEVTSYSRLTITSPANDASIRENTGNVSVSFSITPALDSNNGHYFSISMDGKVVKNKITSTSASLSNVDRGTHKVRISVKDKSGKTLLKSKTITFHLLRFSQLQRQPR